MVVIRRAWPASAMVLLLALGIAALAGSHQPAPRLSQRVDEVSRTLRCPTCEGESVAASETPIARSMRAQVRSQLRAGRRPDQIRAWFIARYGESIVTTPPARGGYLALWLVPLATLGVAALLVTRWARRRLRGAAGPGARGAPGTGGLSGRRLLLALALCLATGVAVPAAVAVAPRSGPGGSGQPAPAAVGGRLDANAWLELGRSLDRQGDRAAAEQAYRRALATAPALAAARTRLAFDLLQERRWREAERLARLVSGHSGRFRTLALLVLGLAEHSQHEPTATATLRTFLRLAPHHPASPGVRRLLRER
jgi:cytochrome c-type biogenesis protein CcmH/NrfF